MRFDGLRMNLAALLGALFVLILGRTLRVYRVGERDPGSGIIYVLWHGRMLVPLFTHRRRRISILISQHRDGEIVSRIGRILGYNPVRGSTTRGGTRALREMIRKAEARGRLAITPDGPRGPRFVFQPGALQLALLSGLPILPVGVSAERKKILSSWDRFIIPLPFSRCVYVFGKPVSIKKEDNLTDLRVVLEKELVKLTETADSYFSKR